MAVNPSLARGDDDSRRYRFIVGVTLAALEDDLNQVVTSDPGLCLLQVFYATGTGYVGVLERREHRAPPAPEPSPEPAPDREAMGNSREKTHKKR